MNSSETILEALSSNVQSLDEMALVSVKNFVLSQLSPTGGFTDRTGTADPYYSMFGYPLVLTLDLDIDLNLQYQFLENYADNHNLDFVHAVSVLRCYMLLAAIDEKKRFGKSTELFLRSTILVSLWKKKLGHKLQKKLSDCFDIIDKHLSRDRAYNHDQMNADHGTCYASFIAWSLFNDLGIKTTNKRATLNCIKSLKCTDDSYSNIKEVKSGVTTSTSAALIIQAESGEAIDNATVQWLLQRQSMHGGLAATVGVPLPDMLSTATAILALTVAKRDTSALTDKTLHFVDLHWDESGGFFGSAADQTPDIEYTYYALLTLGLLS